MERAPRNNKRPRKKVCMFCVDRVEKIDYKDIAKLADILAHSSIETTRIYLMTTGQEHRRQLERLQLVL